MKPSPLIYAMPYEKRLDTRATADIDLIVVHCTELPDLEAAKSYGGKILYPETGTGACGHYYIDRDGTITQFVAIMRVAHHVVGYNHRSIGIELINLGRYPFWFGSKHQSMQEPYPPAQIEALIALIAALKQELPSIRSIAGHEDLDLGSVAASDDPAISVKRKKDPGPLFPWDLVMERVGLVRAMRRAAEPGNHPPLQNSDPNGEN